MKPFFGAVMATRRFCPFRSKSARQDVHVFGMKVRRAGLEVPDILARVRVHRDHAAGKKPVAADLLVSLVAEEHLGLRSGCAEDHQAAGRIVGDRIPNIAAADLPPFVAGPGFGGHLERFDSNPWLDRRERSRSARLPCPSRRRMPPAIHAHRCQNRCSRCTPCPCRRAARR